MLFIRTSLPFPSGAVKLGHDSMEVNVMRTRWSAGLLLLVGLGAASAAIAQETPPQDSLAERVQRLEETVERLQRQLEEQAQAKVQSRLRNRLELSGLILVNGFHNGARVNNSDVPQFVENPQDTSGLPNSHLGGAIRQTRLGITMSGARALGGDLSADLQMDFFGGQQPSGGGRTRPLLRVRTATLKVDWPHIGLLVGQESPLVAPHNPVSFAASGTPGFVTSGNLWLWIPQARLTFEAGSRVRFGVQGAALAPMQPSAQPAFDTQPDSAEKSGRPMAEGRVYVGWGSEDTESQIGFGIHRGWIATTGETLLTSEAYTADLRLALGPKVAILGEAFFNGLALSGLGGGGVGQSQGALGVPVRTQGGWVQLNLRPTFAWELGGGYGFDDPEDTDLPTTGRIKNVSYEGHLHWRPGGGLLMGLEFRRIETTYSPGVIAANHLNWFAGVAF
ncbi:MAG: hypothetical protein Q8Q85_15075 [Gemmatimonadales bacterium]|nr:hypothetical protein [Gemmatimonadales bacterium]